MDYDGLPRLTVTAPIVQVIISIVASMHSKKRPPLSAEFARGGRHG